MWLLLCFLIIIISSSSISITITLFYRNSCTEASDLGLHCLPRSLSWDSRHKWVNAHDSSILKYVCDKCHLNVFVNVFNEQCYPSSAAYYNGLHSDYI